MKLIIGFLAAIFFLMTGCATITVHKSDYTSNDTLHSRPKTPIMGWSSWNHFHVEINEDMIKAQADHMVSSGMQAAGYSYINIDDG